MPRTCAIEKCKRKWREICSCCQKKLCREHLKEHEDLNNPQLNPLIEDIHQLDEHLKSSNTLKLVADCRQKLYQWRESCYQTINQFYEQKCQELDQLCQQKVEQQRIQFNQIQTKITDLIREQNNHQDQVDSTTSAIRDLQLEIKAIENSHFQLNLRPLSLDDSFVFIEESEEKECNLSTLSTPCRTINCSGEWGPALVSNHRYLLIDRYPQLCLVNQQLEIIKEVPWKFDFIRDMSWASTLNSFIVITRSREIYRVEEKTLATELLQNIEDQDWSSCTCSDTSLYLTARREGTNLFQFDLSSSSFPLIKRWKPPHSCKQYEIILNTAQKNQTLALVISHMASNAVHFELRSLSTLHRLWNLPLDITHTLAQPLLRCSSLICEQWLVVDSGTSQLIQVKKDGQIQCVSSCDLSPWNAISFGSHFLAIRTKNSVNLHKI